MKTIIYNEQMLDAVIEDIRNLFASKKRINIEYDVAHKERTNAQLKFWFGALCDGIYRYIQENGDVIARDDVKDGVCFQVSRYMPEMIKDLSIFGLKEKIRGISELKDRELMSKFIDAVFTLIDQDPMYEWLQLHPSIEYNWTFHIRPEEIKAVSNMTLPERDNDYLNWVRTKPCIVCGRMHRSEAHHVKIKELVAMGKKTPDWTALPLCHKCHMCVAHGTGFKEAMEWLPIKMIDFCRLNYVRWKHHGATIILS